MSDHNFEILYKLLVIGNSGVGKTSIMLRYVEQRFDQSMLSTVGVDFKTKVVKCGGRRIKLQIWDTAGHERFRTITGSFYRGAMGILLVYDISDPQSFAETRQWLDNIKEKCSPEDEPVVILVGNKCDLEESRQVQTEEGRRVARSFEILFAETSAATNMNVDQTFTKLVETITRRDKFVASTLDGTPEEPVGDRTHRLEDARGGDSNNRGGGKKCCK